VCCGIFVRLQKGRKSKCFRNALVGRGLPNARSLPALTRMATSSGVQFSNFATCAASNRAGKSFAAQIVIAACIMSSVII
jgi:hypothetical protein